MCSLASREYRIVVQCRDASMYTRRTPSKERRSACEGCHALFDDRFGVSKISRYLINVGRGPSRHAFACVTRPTASFLVLMSTSEFLVDALSMLTTSSRMTIEISVGPAFEPRTTTVVTSARRLWCPGIAQNIDGAGLDLRKRNMLSQQNPEPMDET